MLTKVNFFCSFCSGLFGTSAAVSICTSKTVTCCLLSTLVFICSSAIFRTRLLFFLGEVSSFLNIFTIKKGTRIGPCVRNQEIKNGRIHFHSVSWVRVSWFPSYSVYLLYIWQEHRTKTFNEVVKNDWWIVENCRNMVEVSVNFTKGLVFFFVALRN